MKYFLIFLIFVGFFGCAYADCAGSTLQSYYDNADHVFHGTVVSKQKDATHTSQITILFTIHEVFKGINSEQMIVEQHSYDDKFEQGLEYVVFAHGLEQPLEFDMCNFSYFAFPTVLGMVSHLENPDNEFGNIRNHQITQYLTEPEKNQLEGLDENFAKERQKERDRLFGQSMLIGIPAAIGIGVAVMWVKTMRTK